MTTVGFGLMASVLWGVAGFSGGLLASRMPVAQFVLLVQIVGLVGIVAGLAVIGGEFSFGPAFWWGTAAGLFSAGVQIMFYQALAEGTMSVVAPIAATGVVIPVLAGFLVGERPTSWQFAGIATAIIGIVASGHREVHYAGVRRHAIVLAVGAAVGNGFLLLVTARGSAIDPAVTLLAQHVAVTSIIGGLLLLRQTKVELQLRNLPAVVLVGICELAGWVSYVLAANFGLLALASVLASFSSLVTSLLAVWLCGERLTRGQYSGGAMAICGTVLITAG